MSRLVHGFGINDVTYKVQLYEDTGEFYPNGRRVYKQTWLCPYYSKWKDMLKRVYCKNKRPSYTGCFVCLEWKYLSNFIKWVDKQDDRDWESKSLDKDLLVLGNKEYSPETCVFLNTLTNSFITDRVASRGEFMLGVDSSGNDIHPYKVRCCDPLKRFKRYLGTFDNEIEAHLTWKSKKHIYSCELVDSEKDERVKEALRTRYL